MRWRDVLIGAIASLVVTILAGVTVYYLTREPPPPQPEERLVYDIEEPVTFEAQATKFALLSIRIGNLGDLPAENVDTGIVFEDTTEIIDVGIALSTGPVGTYTVITSTDKMLEFQVPTLTPEEIVVVSFMLSDEPAQDPTIGVKSDSSTGEEGFLARPIQHQPTTSIEDVTRMLIPLITFAVLMVLLYRTMMRLRGRLNRNVNNTAFVYVHKGLGDKAKKMLSDEIESRGGDSYSLSNYALCLALDQDFDEAEKTLDAAEFIASSRHGKAVVLFNRSVVLLLQKKTSEGLNFLRRAMELSPKGIAEYCSYSVVVDDLRKEVEEFNAFLLEKKC